MENNKNFNLESVPQTKQESQAGNTNQQISSEEFKQPKRKKTLKLIIFIIVVILLVAGVAGAAYFAYEKYIKLTPQKVLYNFIENKTLEKIKSFEFDIKTKINTNAFEKYASEMDNPLMDQIKKVNFNLSGEYEELEKTENFHGIFSLIVPDQGFTLEVESLIVDKDVYLKLNKMPIMFSVFLSGANIMDRWVYLTRFEPNKDKEGEPNQTNFFDQEELEEEQEDFKEALGKSNFNTQSIIFSDVPLKVSMGEEKFYHIKFLVSKKSLIDFLSQIKKNSNLESNQKEIQKIIDEIEKWDEQSLVKRQGELYIPPLDIWLEQKTYYPRKINFSLNYHQSLDALATTPEANNNAEIEINLMKINQDMNINKPEEAVEFSNLLKSSFGQEVFLEAERTQNNTSTKTGTTDFYKEDSQDSDADGILDMEEILNWRTDPNQADTDGDGYNDGEEIENGYDPLVPGNARLKE